MKINLKNVAISALSALMCISAMTASAEGFHHGDVNYDNIVDSSDASLILSNYAAVSTNQPPIFDEIKLELADTNGDGSVDAVDASMVLSYYSYASTSNGNVMTPEEYYLSDKPQTPTEPPTESPTQPPTQPPTVPPTESPTESPTQPSIYNYVLNTHTMKAHLPNCRDVDKISSENRRNYYGTVEDLQSMEYSPCKHCYPWYEEN